MEVVGGGEEGVAERLGERSVKLICLSVCLWVCLSVCLSVCMLNVFLMNQLGFKLIFILTRQVHVTLFLNFYFFASHLDGLGRMTRNTPGPLNGP